MSADVRALLDGLAAARERATPGEWAVYWGDHIASGVVQTSRGGVQVAHDICVMHDEDDRASSDNEHNPSNPDADAALIVAAVNSLPKLTAALRAVLAAVDEWERSAGSSNGRMIPRWLVASVVRGVIADALTPEQADR